MAGRRHPRFQDALAPDRNRLETLPRDVPAGDLALRVPEQRLWPADDSAERRREVLPAQNAG